MAIDFDTMKPTDGTGLTSRRGPRTAGPNPFLERGWLKESYDQNVKKFPHPDKVFGPVQGKLVETTISRGDRIGEPTTKWTGDVQAVISLLRTAADKMGIGVSIEIVPARTARNQERAGWFDVKYLGKVRRQKPAEESGDEYEEEEEEYDEETED
jgi:hypothetical protein